jgi:hypothetical protein
LRRPRRVAASLALLTVVLLGHVWLLHGLADRGPAGPRVRAQRWVHLQLVAVATQPPPAPDARAAPAAPSATSPPRRRSNPRPTEPPPGIAALPAAPATPAAAPAAVPARTAEPGETVVPRYATRLPASARLDYELQRGALAGSAQLQWQRDGAAYEMRLDGELQGRPVLASTSRGLIDDDGVAPVRLAERRRARELRAANFQRDAQRITFSGPQSSYPLLPGTQDRLSWMVQLPAIVAADPAHARTGTRLTLYVVGTRGDAQAWQFEVLGTESLDLPAGAVAEALHLQRDAERPYDTRVEVWLDPGRQHLPVRARFTTVPDGTPTELRLAQAVAGVN